ncbi:polysaccharide pyruvyl transferase family protein [Albibacterium indicum]|uniref:polysaccharide pyruvyl transferase family protein n=1 Tax=Albibacterium indicum TaxID=2292082 RepID=UPI000E4B349C|nr:polysaccharide pyruvyl transferase family protein [Pedobacter indicus]
MKVLSRNKGLKTVSIGKKFDWADLNIISPSPFSWMGYVKNADFIFTCMYHGLLFSIKFNKQFAMFLIPERENKCLDFLKRIDLTSRVVRKVEDMNIVFGSQIDYSPINDFLKRERKISVSFLLSSLDSGQNIH